MTERTIGLIAPASSNYIRVQSHSNIVKNIYTQAGLGWSMKTISLVFIRAQVGMTQIRASQDRCNSVTSISPEIALFSSPHIQISPTYKSIVG